MLCDVLVADDFNLSHTDTISDFSTSLSRYRLASFDTNSTQICSEALNTGSRSGFRIYLTSTPDVDLGFGFRTLTDVDLRLNLQWVAEYWATGYSTPAFLTISPD